MFLVKFIPKEDVCVYVAGIIYCLTQKDCEEMVKELMSHGIRADCYHANLDSRYRSRVHRNWVNNTTQVSQGRDTVKPVIRDHLS